MSGAKTPGSEPAETSAKPAVGRGRPPVEHQFKKGVSGKPTGRPRKPKAARTTADMDARTLDEAWRPMSVNEGGRTIQLPAFQVMLRSIGIEGGPHDLAVREMGTGKSRQEVAIGLGLRPWVIAPRLEVIDGIEAVRNLLNGCWFDAAKCAEGLRALRNYRKDWDENRGVWLSKPRHDWASHGADAFRTGATARGPETFGGGKLILPDSGAV
jgi:hypothetical protein